MKDHARGVASCLGALLKSALVHWSSRARWRRGAGPGNGDPGDRFYRAAGFGAVGLVALRRAA